jgi:acetate kinase
MPTVAWRYAVPEAWYREHGVRRYGFHGTSHRFVAARAAELIGRPLSELKLVTAHLGNGCSACAIDGGRSVDTTMGLTPLEGLVMGTRSGDLDPGILAHIANETGQDIAALTKVLNRDSGLLGLSGLSNDLRTLQEAAVNGHAGADLAIAVFCYRLAKAIAALTVALGRLNALVFTGGIGEHSALVRARTLARLGFLGLSEDTVANAAHGPDHGRISQSGGTFALVIPTDEELLIARDTAELIAARSNSRR